MTALLSLTDFSLRLRERVIFGPLAAHVNAGEVVGLIGPNGAGKSSLLRAALGLEPTQGQVLLSGQSLHRLSHRGRAERLAYLPQERVVTWPVTVDTLIRIGARNPQTVDQAIAALALTPLLPRIALDLSGGERARVLLARALAQGAPMLLADEPVAALDPAYQLTTMMALRAHAAGGGGVLVSLHDLTLAARFCDRLLLMWQGRIIAEGTPAQVLTPAMLQCAYGIEARLHTGAGGLLIETLGLSPEIPRI